MWQIVRHWACKNLVQVLLLFISFILLYSNEQINVLLFVSSCLFQLIQKGFGIHLFARAPTLLAVCRSHDVLLWCSAQRSPELRGQRASGRLSLFQALWSEGRLYATPLLFPTRRGGGGVKAGPSLGDSWRDLALFASTSVWTHRVICSVEVWVIRAAEPSQSVFYCHGDSLVAGQTDGLWFHITKY